MIHYRLSRWLLTRKLTQRLLRPLLLRLAENATDWRGGTAEEPTFFSRVLFSFGQWQVELHAFNSIDFEGEFHSHPYEAFRYVLSGGYFEEVVPLYCAYIVRPDGVKEITCQTTRHVFFEGDFGTVQPEHVHRIAKLEPPIHLVTEDPAPLVFTIWCHGERTRETDLFHVKS